MAKIDTFKVTQEEGVIVVAMTGKNLLTSYGATPSPNMDIWSALSSLVADSARNPALSHRLTEALSSGQASARVSKSGGGLTFTFDEGGIPEQVKALLVKMGEDEEATVTRLNEVVATVDHASEDMKRRFPDGPGFKPGNQGRGR